MIDTSTCHFCPGHIVASDWGDGGKGDAEVALEVVFALHQARGSLQNHRHVIVIQSREAERYTRFDT